MRPFAVVVENNDNVTTEYWVRARDPREAEVFIRTMMRPTGKVHVADLTKRELANACLFPLDTLTPNMVAHENAGFLLDRFDARGAAEDYAVRVTSASRSIPLTHHVLDALGRLAAQREDNIEEVRVLLAPRRGRPRGSKNRENPVVATVHVIRSDRDQPPQGPHTMRVKRPKWEP